MKKLFSLDCHCSTTTDLQWMAKQWGDLQIDEWLMSHHCHYVGKERFCPPMLDNGQWRDLNFKMVDEFYATYKDQFKDYDGFVVNYPFPFCLLWEKFDKPIYANLCIRYEYPFSWDASRRNWLHERILSMTSSGQLRVVANNAYDAHYFSRNLGLPCPEVTSNLCAYTEAKYRPVKNHLWVHSKAAFPRKDRLGSPFPRNHSWQELAEALGIFFVPYNVSVMSFFEWYTAGTPLIVPTKKWMRDLGMLELAFNAALPQFDFQQVLDLSDFWDLSRFPHVIKVDSPIDVISVSRNLLQTTHEFMQMDEFKRQEEIISFWRKFLFTN